MKLKPKLLKKKKKDKDKVSYPEDKNPFAGSKPKKKKKSSSVNATDFHGHVAKDKKKKKESKKAKKLKGKRERAVSKAILTLEEEETVRVRRDTIVQKSISELEAERRKNLEKRNSILLSETQPVESKSEFKLKDPINKDANEKTVIKDVKSRQVYKKNRINTVLNPLNETNVKETCKNSDNSEVLIVNVNVHEATSAITTGQQSPSSSVLNVSENERKKEKKKEKIKREKSESLYEKGKELSEEEETHAYDVSNPFAADLEKERLLETKSVGVSTVPTKAKKNPGHAKRNRTSSVLVSSRERKKKKRLKIIKKFKKKKTKEPETQEHEAQEQEKSFNPKPVQATEPDLAQLQEQVEEVKDVMTDRVAEGLMKRQSDLFELLKKSESIELAAGQFAKTNRDIARKKKTEAQCCGIFSKYRICWFLCTCQRGLKLKKKKGKIKKPHDVELTTRDDEDDAYSVVEASTSSTSQPPVVRLRNHNRNNNNNAAVRKLTNSRLSTSSKTSKSSLLVTLQNRRFLESFNRTSYPSSDNTGYLKRKEGKKNGRKYSSAGDLHSMLENSPLLSKVNKENRRSIQETMDQFDDVDDKRKAMELMMLDFAAEI